MAASSLENIKVFALSFWRNRGADMICKKPKTRATHEQTLLAVLEFIERNFSHAIDVEHLHEMTSLSRFHFHRVFRELTGETPGQYVRRKRLDSAMQLLKNGESDLLLLAQRACYTSLSAFTRAFRDQFGITPGTLAYQLQHERSRSNVVPAYSIASDCLTPARFRFMSAVLPSRPTNI